MYSKFHSFVDLKQFLNLTTFVLLTMAPIHCYSQSILLSQQRLRNEPASLENLKIQGQSVALERTFGENSGDIRWLKGISFDVKNESSKTVISATVVLMFRHSKEGVPLLVFPILRGFEDMQGRSLTPELASNAISVAPGGVVNFQVLDARFYNILAFLREKLGEDFNLTSIKLMVERIIYDDDTAYIAGVIMRRDPDKRNRWINADYFDQIKKRTANLRFTNDSFNSFNAFSRSVPISALKASFKEEASSLPRFPSSASLSSSKN